MFSYAFFNINKEILNKELKIKSFFIEISQISRVCQKLV